MTRVDTPRLSAVCPGSVEEGDGVPGVQRTRAVHGGVAVDAACHGGAVEGGDERGCCAGVHVHADAGAIALGLGVDVEGCEAGVGGDWWED